MLNELLSLFFPSICPSCDNALLKGEKIICTHCISGLPIRRTERFVDQQMHDSIVGRLKVGNCYSFLYFYKSGSVQRLLHQFKYNNRPDIGRVLGEIFGRELLVREYLRGIDCIVPVPLHSSRQKSRGYNQSEEFARGIENSVGLPIYSNIVCRVKKSESQTNKSRFQRMKNVEKVFRVTEKNSVQGMHILLVDDVFTTGATIDACGSALYEAEIENLSIATIAHARH